MSKTKPAAAIRAREVEFMVLGLLANKQEDVVQF
jgi:hypothetical protein